MTKRVRVTLPAALAGFMLLVALLYAAVTSVALRVDTYPQTPPFDAMARELVSYLSGDAPALSELFTEREALHMVDVLDLFQGARTIATVCFIVSLILLFIAGFAGDRVRLANGLFIGMALFAGVAAFIGVWAMIDFDGWFTAMHELVFTNDLWLLDPAESMLIQMLPLEFFMSAVRTVALRFAAGAACLLAAALGIKYIYIRKSKT